jgi:DNA-binding XRE family transcriptional regulator
VSKQFEVHPDDVRQLLKIRRYLIGFRKTNGWSQPQLSQLVSGTNGIVWDLEANQSWQWRLSRLQAWCIPFGLRLSAQLTFDATDVDEDIHDHSEVAPMYALSRKPGAWPRWQRIYLTSALTVARKQLGVSTDELARRLGITAKAVWGWEANSDEVMLPKILQHARVLGGRIMLGLDGEDGPPCPR